MEKINKIRFEIICFCIVALFLVGFASAIFMRTTIVGTTVNKIIYGYVLEDLNKDSLKNNIIIDNQTYNSMREHLLEAYPNEGAVTIYGEYDKENDSFTIVSWKEVKMINTSSWKANFQYTRIVGSNFIGTVHSHPNPNWDNSDCSLSNADVNSYNNGGHLPNEIEGIFCNNYTYMIFFAPTNESSNYFVRYVYKGVNL